MKTSEGSFHQAISRRTDTLKCYSCFLIDTLGLEPQTSRWPIGILLSVSAYSGNNNCLDFLSLPGTLPLAIWVHWCSALSSIWWQAFKLRLLITTPQFSSSGGESQNVTIPLCPWQLAGHADADRPLAERTYFIHSWSWALRVQEVVRTVAFLFMPASVQSTHNPL